MSRTLIRLCSIVLLASTAALAQDSGFKWGELRRKVITPESAVKSAFGAGIAQWRDSPHEWGQGMAGYGKRYASRVAHHAVRGSIEFGVAAVRHENLKYERSNREGTWPRIKYALKRTFIVPSTNETGDKFATSRVSGSFGAGLISRAWHPAASASIADGLVSGGFGLGFTTGMNIVREFWPKKRR